jgi:hypothetical protein
MNKEVCGTRVSARSYVIIFTFFFVFLSFKMCFDLFEWKLCTESRYRNSMGILANRGKLQLCKL